MITQPEGGLFLLKSCLEKRGLNGNDFILSLTAHLPEMKSKKGQEKGINRLPKAVNQDLLKLEEARQRLKTEVSLEKVRAVAMKMKEPADMLKICKIISLQLSSLGVQEIRNVQTAILDEPKGAYMNYEYYAKHNKTLVTETSYTNNLTHKAFALKMLKGKGEFFAAHIKGRKLKDWIAYQKTTNVFIDDYLKKASSLNYYWHSLGPVALGISTYQPLSEEALGLFQRFLKVFELAYRRYLDIEIAGAQAREAKIQLALEKVRARTMAMQNSQELKEVITEVIRQLKGLGFDIDLANFNYLSSPGEWVMWLATPERTYPELLRIPAIRHPLFDRPIEALSKGLSFMSDVLTKKEYNSARKHFYKNSRLSEFDDERRKKETASGKGLARSIVFLKQIALTISNFKAKPYTQEQNAVLQRFAKVFEQTYTRFLDLQKAESQAREAEVQLALERVRARTMAMQKSGELPEAANLLFHQVQSLGMPAWSAGYCIWNKDKSAVTLWMSTEGALQPPFTAPTTEDELFIEMRKGHQPGKPLHIVEMGGKKLVKHYRYMRTLPVVGEILDGVISAGHSLPTLQFMHYAYFSSGFLLFITHEPVPAAHGIFIRFANVFDQTYTRFLDLQTAEAQARAAQIEVAVERVRAKALAMYKSGEIMGVAVTMRNELEALNMPGFDAVTITLRQDDGSIRLWDNTSAKTNEEGVWENTEFLFRLEENNPDLYLNKIWGFKEKYCLVEQAEKDLLITIEWVSRFDTALAEVVSKHYKEKGIKQAWHPAVQLSHGRLNLDFYIIAPQPEIKTILLKMGAAFDLAYKRFLDLQKAEAQAREAKIEAALERVRSRSMGMQRSDELMDVVESIFVALSQLGYNPVDCTIFTFDHESGKLDCWSSLPTTEGISAFNYSLPFMDHPMLNSVFRGHRENASSLIYHLAGEEKESYDHLFFEVVKIPEMEAILRSIKEIYANFIFMTRGAVVAFAAQPMQEPDITLLQRFSKVVDLSYTRFLDLHKAEAQAREAIQRASVDRVRAEIASMRTTHDLEKIIPLIWNELTTLKVPFVRCGVFIIDEVQEQIQTLLSTPEGKSIASFQLPFEDTEPFPLLLPHWQRREIYKEHWDDAAFIRSTQIMMRRGAIFSQEQYSSGHRIIDLHLHFIPFLQGMLYVGSEVSLTDDEIQLTQNLADAFSTAYARYEDFNKLEAANNKIEKTLVDLRQTQSQLVQSEKMASLGELTAGIAHEIQNPLNFVNNFSEVSNELIQELKTELATGNREQATEIANNISQNLSKINHHGKRADDIVKSMLQHSRTRSGHKESTDINALCNEYLRLSYHGYRAQDKSFNARFENDLDSTLPKINVVPQDIGRVLLNLINNAFYAVNEKHKVSHPGSVEGRLVEIDHVYDPTVTVYTKNFGDKIEISVKDNGHGIPDNIKDKIFQPFFTTKPAGQGTGLGLSLAYDIVTKGHGGTLEVISTEGVGSEFIITLPFNTNGK